MSGSDTNITRRGALRLAAGAGKAAIAAGISEKLAWVPAVAGALGAAGLAVPESAFAAINVLEDGVVQMSGISMSFEDKSYYDLRTATCSAGALQTYKLEDLDAGVKPPLNTWIFMTHYNGDFMLARRVSGNGMTNTPIPSITFTWPAGAHDTKNQTYPVSVTISGTAEAGSASYTKDGDYYVRPLYYHNTDHVLYLCGYNGYVQKDGAGWFMGPYGNNVLDVSISIQGGSGKILSYWSDIDMDGGWKDGKHYETICPPAGTTVHMEPGKLNSMLFVDSNAVVGGWQGIRGTGTNHTPNVSYDCAVSWVADAGSPIRAKWRGCSCGTILFDKPFTAEHKEETIEQGAESSGSKSIKDEDIHLGMIAYYPASLKGTQFPVMVVAAPGTPAGDNCGGVQTACDGTSFCGELWESSDHLAHSMSNKSGSLALGDWQIQEDGFEGGDDDDKEVQAEQDPCTESDVVVHEAFPMSGPYDPARYFVQQPDQTIGHMYGGEYVDGAVVGAELGPFSWSMENEIKSQWESCLHYMVYGADGAWHEVLYEGAQANHRTGRIGSDSHGAAIYLDATECGFISGGAWQHLPAFDTGKSVSPDYSICSDLVGHVAGNGEWILNDKARDNAMGRWGGNATYLKNQFASGSSQSGWMGWHFTGGSPVPPSDDVLDGWTNNLPDSAAGGFTGGSYADVLNSGSYAACHVAGVRESGISAKSSLTSVRLVPGDNYVWGVIHATWSWDWLGSGVGGGVQGLRNHGAAGSGNEIDYVAQNGAWPVYGTAGRTGNLADGTIFDLARADSSNRNSYPTAQKHYDLALPPSMDVRVGRKYRLKQFLSNIYTPLGYVVGGQIAAEGWEGRWTRWTWAGWHGSAADSARTGQQPEMLQATGNAIWYTGWQALDGEGVVTTRRNYR